MKTQAIKHLVMSFVVTCSFATTNTIAEDRFIAQDAEGFCTSLRLVEHETLTQRIQRNHSALLQQHTALAKHVEKQKFSGLDALITIVMPGGLLYAAIKRSSQLERREELTQLTHDINQLSGDMLTLEPASGNLRIAAL